MTAPSSSRPRPPPLPSTLPLHTPRSPYPSLDVKTPITPPTAYADFLKLAASLTPTTPTLRIPSSATSTTSVDSLRSPLKSPGFASRGYYLIHTPPGSAGGIREPQTPGTAGGVLRIRVTEAEKRGICLMPAPKGKRRRVE